MAFCKIQLMPLRLLLFLFYGAIGCVLPFIVLHMTSLGLTPDEISWLQFVLPFVGCTGPLLGALLADRLGNYKPLLVVSLLACAAAYPCLLLVPPVERRPPSASQLLLSCGPRGSQLGSEPCGGECAPADAEPHGYFVHDCEYRCAGERPPPATPPHLCLERDAGATQCEVLDAGGGLALNASLARRLRRGGQRRCWYPLVDFERGGRRVRSLVCGRHAGCRLRCAVRQADRGPLVADGWCRPAPTARSVPTFWVYFGLRAATEALLALALVLVNATALLLRRRHDSDLGREAAWALLGLATFAPVCGLLLDEQTPAADGRTDLRPGLYAFCALLLVCVLLALVVPERPGLANDGRHYSRLLSNSFFSCELFGVVCALVLLGALWGFLETFLYGHVRALGGSHLQIGLGWTAGVLLLLPFLVKAEALINYCGHHHVLIVALIVYIVRYVSYAYIVSPWLTLVAESLEMFTLHLAWLSAVLFASSQGRPAVEASLQAIITVAHYGIGRGLGAGVVRYVLPLTSGYLVLCAGSVLSAVAAVLYLALYHCCRLFGPRPRSADRRKLNWPDSGGAMLNGAGAGSGQR